MHKCLKQKNACKKYAFLSKHFIALDMWFICTPKKKHKNKTMVYIVSSYNTGHMTNLHKPQIVESINTGSGPQMSLLIGLRKGYNDGKLLFIPLLIQLSITLHSSLCLDKRNKNSLFQNVMLFFILFLFIYLFTWKHITKI